MPTASDDVQIPNDIPNEPQISTTTSAECQSISIGSSVDLTIESGSNNTASLIVSGNISGEVRVKRYIPANQWHLISSPVISQDIWSYATRTSNEIAENSGMRAVTSYDESTDKWLDFPSISSGDDFQPATGYLTRKTADGDVLLAGNLITSDQNISLTRDSN